MTRRDSRKTFDLRDWVKISRKTSGIFITKLITTFFRRMIVVIQPLDELSFEVLQKFPGGITMLSEKDFPAYLVFRPRTRLNIIRARLARGDNCFATWDKDQIVNALWVATHRPYIPYLNRDLILQPGDIYIYDHYTLPAYQGGGLGQANVVRTLRYYREKNYRRAIALLALENIAAFGPTQALGIPTVGLFGCLRLGPWQWNWKKTWAKEPLPILTKPEPSL